MGRHQTVGKPDEKKAKKAWDRVLKCRDKLNDLSNKSWSERRKQREAERQFLLARGWVSESRYDGEGRNRFGTYTHVYKRPTGSTWHTQRGALEMERKRSKRKKRS